MDSFKRYRATFIAAAVLITLVVAVFAISAGLRGAGGSRLIALVHDGDGEQYVLPLDKDAELEAATSLGTNTVVVENGSVRMAEADCPHGDCLRQTPISRPGEQIICLPHELWIEIVGDGAEAGEMDVDAVAYDNGVDTVAR